MNILQAASDWLYVYPPGIQGLLEYTKEKFNNPVIYITENGKKSSGVIHVTFLFFLKYNLYHATTLVFLYP